MKKIIKFIIIIPMYLFLAIEGYIGGAFNTKDIWDDLMKWVKK